MFFNKIFASNYEKKIVITLRFEWKSNLFLDIKILLQPNTNITNSRIPSLVLSAKCKCIEIRTVCSQKRGCFPIKSSIYSLRGWKMFSLFNHSETCMMSILNSNVFFILRWIAIAHELRTSSGILINGLFKLHSRFFQSGVLPCQTSTKASMQLQDNV